MNGGQRRDVILVLLLALVVRLATALLLTRPGYMDAAYYAAGAVRLARGGGLSEPFLWNYLDDPAGLPHAGFLYWMPLPSLLAAPFALLFPGSFFALQIPFILLSALLPPLAYRLAWEVAGRRRSAWLAGLLTLFSGFFFPYWTLPETFAPFALVGSLALWLAGNWRPEAGSWKLDSSRWLLVGLLVGLAHLTRADGILLLPAVALASLISPPSRPTRHEARTMRHVSRLIVCHFSFVVLGYLLVMAPWFLRNLSAIGTPFSAAGARTLWLRTYDDLFCYGCDLSLRSYLAWGWPGILRSKLWAVGVNLERFLAEDCLVFLLPFVLIGLHRFRRRSPFTSCLAYLLLVYLTHSLAFTFPGPRGGFFHASAAALPFLFAAGAEGLEAAVGWAAHRRRWDRRQAQVVFATAAVVAAVALSARVAAAKLPAWRDADVVYEEVGRWLAQQGEDEATVMVGNPPAFWSHTGHPAVAVPNGDVETLLAACDRYGASYVVLDPNHPGPLRALYERRLVPDRLALVAMFEDRVMLWRVEP
jgi:4-amino-4-deoxy-L-arabinose transferase-like glycosyltransferase